MFLSPHLDDVVLSCGALLSRMAGNVEDTPEVLTVFAGDAQSKYSEIAATIHKEWQLSGDIVAARRREDQRALAHLGLRAHHLTLPEALYRTTAAGGHLYPTEESLFRKSAPPEFALCRMAERILRGSLEHLNAVAVYLPLGIGGHVDHLLARKIGERVAGVLGLECGYFEDLPYGLDPDARLAASEGSLQERSAGVNDVDVSNWLAAVEHYESQLSSLFKTSEWRQLLREHLQNETGPSLRLWSRRGIATR